MGVLAIDPGTRKSGFAVADRTRIAMHALPGRRVGSESPELLEHVAALVAERDVDVLLVGLPFHMDGAEAPGAKASRNLAARLRERFPELEVVVYDERLTTKEAESRLRELGYGAREIAARKDSWAALVLLEDWVRSGEPRPAAPPGGA